MQNRHVPFRVASIQLSLFAFLFLIASSIASLAAEEIIVQPIAHRGLLLHSPENTLANFTACQQLRLGFEFDVRRSNDGVLVCLHDSTLQRTTTGTGAVVNRTWEGLSQLDAGSWFGPEFRGEKIPTIEQVFRLIAAYPTNSTLFLADLKAEDEQLEADIVTLAQSQKIGEQLLYIGRAIDQPDVRARLRKADPKCHVACLAQTLADLDKALLDRNSDWVYLRFIPDADSIAKVRAAGKKTIVAGITVSGQQSRNWQNCAKADVDAVLTDYPLEFRLALRELVAEQLKARLKNND